MYKVLFSAGLVMMAGHAMASEIDSTTTVEVLDKTGQAPWKETRIGAVLDTAHVVSKVGAELADDQRFGRQVTEAEVFAVSNVRNDLALEYRLRGSTGADFLAKKGGELTLYAGLPGHLESTVSLTRNLYAKDAASVVRARLDRDFGAWRLGAGVIADTSQHVQTGFLSIGYEAGRWSTRLTYYRGQEANRDDAGTVTVMSAKAVAYQLRYKVSKALGVVILGSRTTGLDARKGVSVGLTYAF